MSDGGMRKQEVNKTTTRDVTKSSHSVTDETKPTEDTNANSEKRFINTVEENSTQLLYYDGRVNGQEVKVLVDSGSMGNYISADATWKLKLKMSVISGQTLVFAGRNSKWYNKEARAIKLYLGPHCERIHLQVVPLSHHDIILEKLWLDLWNLEID